MKQLIACCGLDCESCDARIATVKNDDELREKTAQKWSAMNNAPEITAATINCMGCRTDGMKFAYCSDYCEIRKCVYLVLEKLYRFITLSYLSLTLSGIECFSPAMPLHFGSKIGTSSLSTFFFR